MTVLNKVRRDKFEQDELHLENYINSKLSHGSIKLNRCSILGNLL